MVFFQGPAFAIAGNFPRKGNVKKFSKSFRMINLITIDALFRYLKFSPLLKLRALDKIPCNTSNGRKFKPSS